MADVSDAVGQFKVTGSFTLESLDLFVVLGDVVAGSVASGMSLHVPLSSRATRAIPIRSVEAAIPVAGSGSVGLTFEAADWARLAGMGFKALATGPVLEVS